MLQKDLFAQEKWIRVLIQEREKPLYLSVRGKYTLSYPKSDNPPRSGYSLKGNLQPTVGGFQIGKKSFPRNRIYLHSEEAKHIKVGKRQYRGDLEILKTEKGFQIINHLKIEDYLRGVLAAEMYYYWPKEALKAQAVAARTYSLYSLKSPENYDLRACSLAQNYKGISEETSSTDRVVKETKELVLSYQGALLPAYYSSTCGGYTEWADQVWEKAPPCIIGVKCPHCRCSPHYSWRKEISLSKLSKLLTDKGYPMNRIITLKILSYSPSRRVNKVVVVHAKGRTTFKGNQFRLLLGNQYLKSTLFRVKITRRGRVKFSGRGFGHGVGLCQWGAKNMAERDYDFKQILKFYYPQAELIPWETD